MFVGNPPQKVRALFDTGSTNTWILNKKTELSNHKEKEFSYDDTSSKTNKKSEQKAVIQFGSGALAGHFFRDDIRLGSCDGSKSNRQILIKQQKFGNVEKQKTIFTGSNFEINLNVVKLKFLYVFKLDDIQFNGKSTGVCT